MKIVVTQNSARARFAAEELSKALLSGAKGNIEETGRIYIDLYNWISKLELEIQQVFDLFLFNKFYSRRFKVNNAEFCDGIHN